MHLGFRFIASVGFVASSLVMIPCACRGGSKHSADPLNQQATTTNSSVGANDQGTAHPPGCPTFAHGRKIGQIENEELSEASDLAASVKNPGVLWSHNDSGGRARLFALTSSGRDLGAYHLEGATLEDWEDLAIGPGPVSGTSYLYVGDIGANNQTRKRISVYRVEEPPVATDQKPKKRRLGPVSRFDFIYPDLMSRDAESLMIDPQKGDLYLVTKPRHGAPVVYRAKAPLDALRTKTLEQVVTLSTIGGGPLMPTLVTSADISRDGSMILLRTYVHAYLWQRHPEESIDTALSRPPCPVPLHAEPQGESIAFAPDGKGYYTVSEGNRPVIYFFERGD